jgi:hypothetical protein
MAGVSRCAVDRVRYTSFARRGSHLARFARRTPLSARFVPIASIVVAIGSSIIVPEKARGVGAIIGTPSRVGELKTARSSEDGPRVGTARPVVVRKG